MELTEQQQQEIATEQSNTILKTLGDQVAELSIKNAHLTGALRGAEAQIRLLMNANAELEARLPKDEPAPEQGQPDPVDTVTPEKARATGKK